MMKGLVVQRRKVAGVVKVAQPNVRPGYVKIKVVAVALNPTDWKHIDFVSDRGALVGCDYAGIVTEIGPGVKSDIQVGDGIAGWAHGGNVSNHNDGCFSEYAVVRDGIFMKIPEYMSFDDACTLGIGTTTVGLAMYKALDIPLPDHPQATPFPILIYGGSTATGTLAIQFAKLSGLQVITTASSQNHAMLLSLGADRVFDYKSSTCSADIRKATNNTLRYCLDCVSSPQSMAICAGALSSSQNSHYSSLLSAKDFPRQDVHTTTTMAYTAFGESYVKSDEIVEANFIDYEFGVTFWALSQKLFEDKKVKVHPTKVMSGGLRGIPKGLQLMRERKVSATKLVYRIEETR